MIPYSPLGGPSDGEDAAYVAGRTTYTIALIAMSALVVVMIVFGLLNGGRVGPTGSPVWDVVVPWSFFTIPPWLVIALSIVPPLAALVIAARVRWEQSTDITFLVTTTILLYVVMPIAFSRLYPSADGPSFDPLNPQLGLNVHWWAAIPQILTLAILTAGMVRAGIRHRTNAAKSSTREESM